VKENSQMKVIQDIEQKCPHCGDPCVDYTIMIQEMPFCCLGCKTVYQLLEEHDLSCFYDIDAQAGSSQKEKQQQAFNYLEDKEFIKSLLHFENSTLAKVSFTLPAIHCAACIWLLEKLYKFNEGIEQSTVNFGRKTITITYQKKLLSLKELVEILDKLGYTPELNGKKHDTKNNPYQKIWLQIGIAGFAFINSMFFSLPAYFGLEIFEGGMIAQFFPYLNALLAIPVLLFSATDYFKSALGTLKMQRINMDVPISIGIITLFVYSYYIIFFQHGLGYVDSFAGLLFFLLLGKYYQQKTFDHLQFDREVKSFFPISVTKVEQHKEEQVLLKQVLPQDILRIRNQEIIPADCLLLSDAATIDYSFVTGESLPEEMEKEDLLYAGGRLKGASILVQVKNSPSQSYLAQLWDDESLSNSRSQVQSLADEVSKYFTLVILLIAALTLAYWLFIGEFNTAINAFSTVLIIACPCALALASPVTLGHAMRILGKEGFFSKNTQTVERLSHVDTLVFDKTGTLTYPNKAKVCFMGELPAHHDLAAISTLLNQSQHPLSQLVYNWLPSYPEQVITAFKEKAGKGLSASSKGQEYKLGKLSFVKEDSTLKDCQLGSQVHLSIAGTYCGYFQVQHIFREGMDSLFKQLNTAYETHLISGDNDNEISPLRQWILDDNIQFKQLPGRKKSYIASLNAQSKKVLMVGDGLNDAGALSESYTGIAITESSSQFSPASDAIMLGNTIHQLPAILKFSKHSMKTIKVAFTVSFLYNIIGISLAVQGLLSPVFAAILMPISSVTVVLIGTLGTQLGKQIFTKHQKLKL
jgi:Cu+-exporting ATPase